MKYLFLSLISLVSLILSSCAVYSQGSFQAQQDPTSVSPVLSAGEGDAHVVFYRLGEDFPLPVSIYINGDLCNNPSNFLKYSLFSCILTLVL